MRLVCTALFLSVLNLPAQTISTAHYQVQNTATFPYLPLPTQSLVFLNGIYQNKGSSYTTPGGNRLAFNTGVIKNGDTVDVVSWGFPATITDEVPQYQRATNTWTLLHAPLAGSLQCWRNAQYQTRTAEPGHPEFQPDYSINGSVISSPFWKQLSSDGSVEIHRCSYSWIPAP